MIDIRPEEVPVIFLYPAGALHGVNKAVGGFTVREDDLSNFAIMAKR